jgi:hypothetical protein
MDLRELMEALTGHGGCGIEDTIASQKAALTLLPALASSDEIVMEWAVARLRQTGTEAAIESRKQELQLELRMLEKPDDVDLASPEYEHARQHLDSDTLTVEIRKREGVLWQRAADLFDATFGNDPTREGGENDGSSSPTPRRATPGSEDSTG